MNKVVQTLQSRGSSTLKCVIVRHELPTSSSEFWVDMYGFRELSFLVEDEIPVLYEIAVFSEEDDSRPWPHRFAWIETGEMLNSEMRSDSFVGSVRMNGRTVHLFRDWRA